MIPDRFRPLAMLVVLVNGLIGCGPDARFVRDTPSGGVVSYSIETDSDILTSSGRREAFRMIKEKCPKGSAIVKEGELPKVSAAADRAWRGQIGTDRLWGIQFTCE